MRQNKQIQHHFLGYLNNGKWELILVEGSHFRPLFFIISNPYRKPQPTTLYIDATELHDDVIEYVQIVEIVERE
jgi:hypothetical protein